MQPQQVNEQVPTPKVEFLDPVQIYEQAQQVATYDNGRGGMEIKQSAQKPTTFGASYDNPINTPSQTFVFQLPVGGAAMLQSKNSYFKVTNKLVFQYATAEKVDIARLGFDDKGAIIVAVEDHGNMIGERISLDFGVWYSTPLMSLYDIDNDNEAIKNCDYYADVANKKPIATAPLNAFALISSIYTTIGGQPKIITDCPAIGTLLQAQIPQQYQETMKNTFFNSENVFSTDIFRIGYDDDKNKVIWNGANGTGTKKTKLGGWLESLNKAENQAAAKNDGYATDAGMNYVYRTVTWDWCIPQAFIPMFDQADSLFQTNLLSQNQIDIKITTQSCNPWMVYGAFQRYDTFTRADGAKRTGSFMGPGCGITNFELVKYETWNADLANAMKMIQTGNRNNYTWYEVESPPTQQNQGAQQFQLANSTKSLRYNAICSRPTDQSDPDDSLFYHGYFCHLNSNQFLNQLIKGRSVSDYIHWLGFKVSRGGQSDQIFSTPLYSLTQCIQECKRSFGYLQQYAVGTSLAFASEFEYLTKFHIVCVNYESFALLNAHPVQHDGINTYDTKINVTLELGIYKNHQCNQLLSQGIFRYETDNKEGHLSLDTKLMQTNGTTGLSYGVVIIDAQDYHTYFDGMGGCVMSDALMP